MVHKISDDEYLKEFNSDFPETDEQLERKLKQLIELNKMRMEKDNLSAIAIYIQLVIFFIFCQKNITISEIPHQRTMLKTKNYVQ